MEKHFPALSEKFIRALPALQGRRLAVVGHARPDGDCIGSQLGLTLAQYGIFVRKGFTSNNSFNLPVVACSDSTPYVPVVYFRHGNSTNIHLDNDCIIAEAAENAGFIMVKDRLLYGMLGVMK